MTEVLKKQDDLNKHWFGGSFPDAWLAKNELQRHAWKNNFFGTFIESDLNTLFGISFSADLMFKLRGMLAHFYGGIWNAQPFGKGPNTSPTTVNRYIEYLEGAFMIRRLPAYFINAKKRLIQSPKIYLVSVRKLVVFMEKFSFEACYKK